MTEMNPKKAREMVVNLKLEINDDIGDYYMAKGFLEGMEWERKRAEGLVTELARILFSKTCDPKKIAFEALAAYHSSEESSPEEK